MLDVDTSARRQSGHHHSEGENAGIGIGEIANTIPISLSQFADLSTDSHCLPSDHPAIKTAKSRIKYPQKIRGKALFAISRRSSEGRGRTFESYRVRHSFQWVRR
jgi:hypothetical protein